MALVGLCGACATTSDLARGDALPPEGVTEAAPNPLPVSEPTLAERFYAFLAECLAGEARGCEGAADLRESAAPEARPDWPREPSTAALWLRACEGGRPSACRKLARVLLSLWSPMESLLYVPPAAAERLVTLLDSPYGPPHLDRVTPFTLVRYACLLDDAEACMEAQELAVSDEHLRPLAFGLAVRACELGLAVACTQGARLAFMFPAETGATMETRADLYERGCTWNDAAACYQAALLWRSVLGVRDEKPQQLLRRACELGHPAACVETGQ